jgi:hypothetical protein
MKKSKKIKANEAPISEESEQIKTETPVKKSRSCS